MTELRWLTCLAPTEMLRYYDDHFEVTEYRWRQIICAFVRQSWHVVNYDTRMEVERQERLGFDKPPPLRASQISSWLHQPSWRTAHWAMTAWKQSARQRADLLRCVIGNAVKPVWKQLAWHTPHAIRLAAKCREVTATRDDFLVFSDAAEDAGLPEGLLRHLREEPCHSPYCHVPRFFL